MKICRHSLSNEETKEAGKLKNNSGHRVCFEFSV